MHDCGPCPICGGVATESDYDRSAGQVSCGGECGWALPADAWRRLADAAALARAVGRLEGEVTMRQRAQGWHAFAPAGRSAYGDTLAAALVALAGEVGE